VCYPTGQYILKLFNVWRAKFSSFCIDVPAAQLFAREIYRATAGFLKSSRLIKVTGDLKKEIEYWRFLDSWEGHLLWLPEHHVCLKVFSDASDFAWGGIISIPGSLPFKTRDYWKPQMLHLPIVVKEARALANVLDLLSATRVWMLTSIRWPSCSPGNVKVERINCSTIRSKSYTKQLLLPNHIFFSSLFLLDPTLLTPLPGNFPTKMVCFLKSPGVVWSGILVLTL